MSVKSMIIAFVIVIVLYEIILIITGLIKAKKEKKNNECKEVNEDGISTSEKNKE